MPDLWKPHATVAALIERDGRFLCVEENTADGLRINQPAGHLEHGESLIDAVVRETLEETAHDFRPSALLGMYLMPTGPALSDTTYLRVAFLGQLGRHHAGRALDPDIVRTLWLTREDIAAREATLRSPLVLQCVDDFLAGKRGALELVVFSPLHPPYPNCSPASGRGACEHLPSAVIGTGTTECLPSAATGTGTTECLPSATTGTGGSERLPSPAERERGRG